MDETSDQESDFTKITEDVVSNVTIGTEILEKQSLGNICKREILHEKWSIFLALTLVFLIVWVGNADFTPEASKGKYYQKWLDLMLQFIIHSYNNQL